MIPELYRSPLADQSVQKALEYLHKNAVPIKYVFTEPSLEHVPTGQIVIHDNGSTGTANVMRIYMRTGKDNVGYVALTQLTA